MFFRKIPAALAAVATTALTALALGAPAAQAAPAPRVPATPQCAAIAFCVTPDFFADGGVELAMSAPVLAKNAPVISDDASSTAAAQDFHLRFVGTVAGLTNNGDGPFQYGLTQQDYSSFGSSPVFQLQATPFGQPTNFCVANLNNTVLRIRQCSAHRWQLYIQVSEFQAVVAGISFPCTPPPSAAWADECSSGEGAYYVSAVGGNSVVGHLAVTGQDEGAPVALQFPQGTTQQNIDANDGLLGG